MSLLSKLFGSKKASTSNQTSSIPTEISVRNTAMQSEHSILSVHSDIRDYLWIGDGKQKNYFPTPSRKTLSSSNGIILSISFGEEEEPSLLYLGLPISNSTNPVERPPYYPTYRGLTPEQRGVYWRLLANPYDNTIDVGYVFILYYGLERYLLTDKYENVIDIILKLRDVHSNKSFQMYTANAIILTCLSRQRADIVNRFMNSLDKEHEFNFSPNLFLLCKYALRLPLTAEDTMRLAKSFEFTKSNYINKYPDLFRKTLSSNISEKYKEDAIPWEKLLSNTDFKRLPSEETTIFANISIRDKTIKIPSIISSFKLKKNIYDLLDRTHEDVKKHLTEMKKEGLKIPERSSNKKEKEEMTFDKGLEGELLAIYKKAKNDSLEQHFASISLQDFYYKYRGLDSIYLDKCIEYCKDDISRLPNIQRIYIADERQRILSRSLLSPTEKQHKISEITPFNGSIPAFKRLAIIYEKEKDYSCAINICDQAISYYTSADMPMMVLEFNERRMKLMSKTQ